jgi:hypothetical protein
MLRKILLVTCVLGLTAPVMAYNVIWDGVPADSFMISLQIDCYIQIDRQDTEIIFNDGTTPDPVTGTYDFYASQLEDVVYTPGPDTEGKHSTDPWAGDHYYCPNGEYWESADGAVIFIRSNNDLTMIVHVKGNLEGTINSSDNKIPTWITICFAPFVMDGQVVDDGRPGGVNPFHTGPGAYAFGPIGGGTITLGDETFPNQHAFECDPYSTTWTVDMPCWIEGTVKFLARIWRNGMQDQGDLYVTYVDVDFTSP